MSYEVYVVWVVLPLVMVIVCAAHITDQFLGVSLLSLPGAFVGWLWRAVTSRRVRYTREDLTRITTLKIENDVMNEDMKSFANQMSQMRDAVMDTHPAHHRGCNDVVKGAKFCPRCGAKLTT